MILNAIIEKDEFGYFAQIPELKGYRMVLPHHSGEILHPKIIKQLFEIIDYAT